MDYEKFKRVNMSIPGVNRNDDDDDDEDDDDDDDEPMDEMGRLVFRHIHILLDSIFSEVF